MEGQKFQAAISQGFIVFVPRQLNGVVTLHALTHYCVQIWIWSVCCKNMNKNRISFRGNNPKSKGCYSGFLAYFNFTNGKGDGFGCHFWVKSETSDSQLPLLTQLV